MTPALVFRSIAALYGFSDSAADEALSLFELGDLLGAIWRFGRDLAPHIVDAWWTNGLISQTQLGEVIGFAWCASAWPSRMLPRRRWLEMFEAVGFVGDGGRPAPVKPMEVWRAQVGRVYGLAWITSQERAEYFHDLNERKLRLPHSRLLHAVVQPKDVLGILDGRGEEEVIVHPRAITRVPGRSS